MTRVLVLYYSARGHIGSMAHAVAEGASQAGASVSKRFTYQTILTGAVARNSSVSPLAEAIKRLDCSLLSGQVYIAGPPGFVDAAAELVSTRHCLTGVILTDRFELSAAAAATTATI